MNKLDVERVDNRSLEMVLRWWWSKWRTA